MPLPCTLHPQTSAGQTHSPRGSCWERTGEGKGMELAVHCPGGTWTLTFTLHSDPGGQSPSSSHYSGKLMWQTERVVQRSPRPRVPSLPLPSTWATGGQDGEAKHAGNHPAPWSPAYHAGPDLQSIFYLGAPPKWGSGTGIRHQPTNQPPLSITHPDLQWTVTVSFFFFKILFIYS